MEIFIQCVVSGMLYGGVFGLFSLGLALIFGVMDIVNFAHGEFLMLAMYATFFWWKLFGLDPFTVIPLIIPMFFVFGILIERQIH